MSNKDTIQLTQEELNKVNKIISGIQSELNLAIDKLRSGDFEGALKAVNNGLTKSNCPICKREIGILIADIVHNKEICILKSETCKDEQQVVINKAIELKDDFIPVIQNKKAIKDKKKEIQKIINAATKTEDIQEYKSILPPSPFNLFSKLINKK